MVNNMNLGFKKTTLSGDEYCDIYADIILEYYRRIISDDKIFVPLKITKQKQEEFSIELSLLLLVIAMRAYELENNRRVIADFVKGKTCESLCSKLFDYDDDSGYLELFNARYTMFEELSSIKDTKVSVDNQLLGMARYFISQFSNEKKEEKNKDVIIALNEQLSEFYAIVHKLAFNSMLKKSSALVGKYDFIVMQ